MTLEVLQLESLRHILREAISRLCKDKLSDAEHLTIEAVIGLTVNKTEVLLVSLNETLISGISGQTLFCSCKAIVKLKVWSENIFIFGYLTDLYIRYFKKLKMITILNLDFFFI